MKTLLRFPYFEKFVDHFSNPGIPDNITNVLFDNIKHVSLYLFDKDIVAKLQGLDLKDDDIFNSLENNPLPSNCIWIEIQNNVLMEYSNDKGVNSAVIGALVVNEDTNYSGLLFVCEFTVTEHYTALIEDTLKVAYFNFNSTNNDNDANKMLQIMIQKYNTAIQDNILNNVDPMKIRVGQNKKRFDLNNIFEVRAKEVIVEEESIENAETN